MSYDQTATAATGVNDARLELFARKQRSFDPELTVPVINFLLIYDTFIHEVAKRKVNFKFTNDNSSVKYHLLIPWRPSCKA